MVLSANILPTCIQIQLSVPYDCGRQCKQMCTTVKTVNLRY